MANTQTITLQSPIKFGEETISTISLRDAKAKDFRNLKSLDKPFAMMLDLASELSGLPAVALDELAAEDFSVLMEAMSGFLAGFQVTGKTS